MAQTTIEAGTIYPVAVLGAPFRDRINSEVKTVGFSPDSLEKNKLHHPELTVSDYRKVQRVIEDAGTIIQDGGRTLVFLMLDGKIYHAVVKATDSGEYLFMTSLRITSMEDVVRAKKRGVILKDEM